MPPVPRSQKPGRIALNPDLIDVFRIGIFLVNGGRLWITHLRRKTLPGMVAFFRGDVL